MTYVMIADAPHLTNTEREVEEARVALKLAGEPWAAEYAGLPDGTGDSYLNGNKLFAEPTPADALTDIYERLTVIGLDLDMLQERTTGFARAFVTNASQDVAQALQRLEDALPELEPTEHPEDLPEGR